MKKLLFISSRPIYPIVGGDQIRTAQCLEFLRLYFDVHVIIIGSDENLSRPDNYGSYKYFQNSKLQHLFQALNFVLNDLPIQVNYYYNKKGQKYIDSIIHSFDVVFCNNLRTAQYVRKYKSVIRVIDFVDAISMNYDKARKYARFPMKWIYTIDWKRCKIYESTLLDEFDRACVISEVDKAFILDNSNCNKKLSVIGNMANVSDIVFPEENGAIVFVGKMNYAPNILAVKNFVSNIFPFVVASIPTVKFYVVGTHPTREIQNLDNSKNIFVTGYVEDTNEYLDRASVVIAPMISGAGIQNKIIQAMGRGRCVVTTKIGSEGLSIEKGEIGIANSNLELANLLVSLLNDPAQRVKMGKLAKGYIMERLSRETIGKEFQEFIQGAY